MEPYIEKWPYAMALGLQLNHLNTTFNSINKISDEIWNLAGDKSTDVQWYIKRSALVKVYIATETFMIDDKSTDYEATWEFLDRRLEDLEKGQAILNSSNPTETITNLGVATPASVNSVAVGFSTIASIVS